MSGGSFNYIYQKIDPDFNTFEDMGNYLNMIKDCMKTVSKLMKDVEWVTSCDSSWDTEMAGEWYRTVYNLCCKLSSEGEETEKITPPHAPTHFPHGKAHCIYCGAKEENWAPELAYHRN